MPNTTRLVKPHLYSDFIYFQCTTEGRKVTKLKKILHNSMVNMIKKKRAAVKAKIASGKFDPEDTRLKATTDLMVELAEQGAGIDDNKIIDEMTTLLFGASDSSSITTSFCLMLLGMYPLIQEKVYEELHDIFGDSDRLVDPKDIPKMQYLDLVIKETLRIFPIAPFIMRQVSKNIQLTDCTIPKGCNALVSILSIHRDPEFWKNPLEFDPDRFLPENMEAVHCFAYIPFSWGVRSCPGYKYSNVSLKTILATILRRYKVICQYKTPAEVRLGFQMFLTATDGYMIAIESRNH